MAFDLGVDRLPFVGLLFGGLFAQANQVGDVIRPGGFARMGKLVVVALGLLQRTKVALLAGLLGAGGERPHRSRAAENREEVAPSHVIHQ